MSVPERKVLIETGGAELPISTQAEPPGLNRSGPYCKPVGSDEEDLKIERMIGELHGRFINSQIAQRKPLHFREKVLVGLLYRDETAFTAASNPQNFVQNHNDETNMWRTVYRSSRVRLSPDVRMAQQLNVSDGGSGLVKGVREAFPEIEFPRAPEPGKRGSERGTGGNQTLIKIFELECRVQTTKTYLPTKREYNLMRQNTSPRLLQADSLRILYDWLRECTAFSGYGYQDSLELC